LAYLGNQPSNNFVSLKRQVITGNGGSTYTLDHAVASVNDVAIFVNNVRQDPASYSISGTALTLGGTISSSDSCYVIFLGQALQTVTPATGTVTGAMMNYPLTNFSSTGIDDNADATAITIDSSERILMPSQPFFYAKNTGTGSESGDGITTTPAIFPTAVKDVGSNLSNTNSRFTAPVDGLYFFTSVPG